MMAVAERFARRVAWFRASVEARLRGERGEALPADLASPEPREERLCRLLHLDPAQLRYVWACVCAAADPLLHAPLVAVGGADARRGLSLATYSALTADEPVGSLTAWLSSEPAIVRFGLLAPTQGGMLPGTTPFAPAARLVSYLRGSDALDPAITRAGGVVAMPARYELDRDHRALIERLTTTLAQTPAPLVVLVGAQGIGRRTIVAAAVAASKRAVVAVDGARALGDEELVGALHREALLLDAVPVISDADELVSGEHQPERRRRFARAIDDVPGPIVITTSDDGFDLSVARPVVRLRMRALEGSARAALWRAALAGTAADDAVVKELAIRYQLGPGGIRAATDAARRVAPTGEPVTRAHLIEGVRTTIVERFAGLAERLDVSDRWEDVVLPAETFDQIDALVARVQYAYRVYEEWKFPRSTARGGGVAALFSGPPGTGKTLVAGLIARELERDVFRVDLSRVVSKWVGETEKQLSKLFDAAESSDALLLFDEADSLFARRTEVKSSSDRYANLEVNYLLQRIETFGGVTILTTNLDTSIDAALRRRLATHVVFWPPELEERIQLWRRYATCGAPTTGVLELDALAEEFPDMTGANIRNASLAAAFLAAADGGALSQDLLVRAARSEYRSMGRVLGRPNGDQRR